ncbi:fimbria/pilus periplasmic chaperone [Endozoicomonas sp. GU-1]|uniref:fimbrial biogenesis chaperone n=1 Tax=Endozoicomonas sp. GU-1 TaxID=3009078 RepID=UPI0022B50EC9|nr:fimbria/pilus periplasmic chaperone [Endozoicomonas sp. GU-1]WBA83437.1 fimbria/pilus periplasmic chaperone [Endozoicomonas sp. GU-1]WBA86369.1 fimbria/pilus periplasmic chaperone [Endozoicomonas sp. GU-1]
MKHTRFLAGIAGLLLSQCLYAQLAIDRIIVDFNEESPNRDDVQLVNTSATETLFINIEVLEVNNPGTEEETRVITDDPAKIGLIATPNQVILPPNTRRLVRLVNLLPAEGQERIFRVNFSPVSDELETGNNAVKLMVGYQALIMVRPEKTVFALEGQRNGNTLTLTNNSNTNVMLNNIRQCTDQSRDDCTRYVERRLYPGNVWSMDLTGEGPLSLTAADGTALHNMTF